MQAQQHEVQNQWCIAAVGETGFFVWLILAGTKLKSHIFHWSVNTTVYENKIYGCLLIMHLLIRKDRNFKYALFLKPSMRAARVE